MEKIKEVKGHPKLMSDSKSSYACVPSGAHFVSFKQVEQWSESIQYCRDNYEGGTSKLTTKGK